MIDSPSAIFYRRSSVLYSRPNFEKRPMKKKLRVGLLFGGKSAEHEISLISARNIVEAMDKTKYDVVAIGIDKQGRWHLDEGARLLHGVAQPEVAFKDAKNIAAVQPGNTATPVGMVMRSPCCMFHRCRSVS